MVVLISGITGLVGRRLAAHLKANGHIVRGLSRSAHDADTRAPHAEALFSWDATTSPPPPAAVEGADAVVHLAGEPVVGRWTTAKRRAISTSRIESTRQLVAGIAANAAPPRRLISASAIGYYGDRHEQTVDEGSPPGDGFLASVCVDWETVARSAPVRVTCVRIGVVLDGGGGALAAMLRPFRWGLGGRLGSGKQWWSWIHIDDLVGIIFHALTHEVGPTLNAVSPHPVRQDEFARTLADCLRRPAVLPAPAFAIRALLGGFSAELLTSRRVVPKLTLESGFVFDHPLLPAALGSLLSPRSPGDTDRERSTG